MWRPDESRRRLSPRHLYARHAEAAERAGWSVERDVRWSSVDLAKARRRPDILAALRAAAFVESCHPLHIGRLIAVAWDDVDACVVLAAAMYESVRHFHAIRTYLEAVSHEPRITDEELVEIRRPVAIDGGRATDVLPRLVELMLSAHLASYFYRRLGEQACDPVLAELLALAPRDEPRHFAFYFKQAERRLTRPGAARVARFLVDRFWAPVGAGVRPFDERSRRSKLEELANEGRAAARRIDATIRKLPGFADVDLVEAWVERHVGVAPSCTTRVAA